MKLPQGIGIRSGSYVAYVTMNGKPVRKVVGQVGCITPKQAAQERTDLMKDIRDGKYPPAPKPELAVLKALMRHGARSGEIERVPMFPKRLKESKPRAGFIDEKQYILLRTHARDLWLRTFLALGFNFGFRKGELLSLRVRNADLLEGWLSIDTSKNGDSRKVKLTQETLTLLAECVRGVARNRTTSYLPGKTAAVLPNREKVGTICVAGPASVRCWSRSSRPVRPQPITKGSKCTTSEGQQPGAFFGVGCRRKPVWTLQVGVRDPSSTVTI